MRDKLEWIVKRGIKYSIRAGYWLLGAIVGAEEAKYDMASLLNRRLEEIIPPDEKEDPEDFSSSVDILPTFVDIERRRLSDMEREVVDLELAIFKKKGDVAAAPNLTEADQLNEELGFMTRRLVKYYYLLTSFGGQYEEISDEPESEGDPLPWLDRIRQTSSFKELGEVLMAIPPRLLYQCTNLLRQKREEFSGEETDKEIFSKQLEQLLKNITDPSKE